MCRVISQSARTGTRIALCVVYTNVPAPGTLLSAPGVLEVSIASLSLFLSLLLHYHDFSVFITFPGNKQWTFPPFPRHRVVLVLSSHEFVLSYPLLYVMMGLPSSLGLSGIGNIRVGVW